MTIAVDLERKATKQKTNITNHEPAHEILVLITLASSLGSDEPAHMHRLARAFAAHIHKIWMWIKT